MMWDAGCFRVGRRQAGRQMGGLNARQTHHLRSAKILPQRYSTDALAPRSSRKDDFEGDLEELG